MTHLGSLKGCAHGIQESHVHQWLPKGIQQSMVHVHTRLVLPSHFLPIQPTEEPHYLQNLLGSTFVFFCKKACSSSLSCTTEVYPAHSPDHVLSLLQTLSRVSIVIGKNSKSLEMACKTLKDLALQQLGPHGLPLPAHQAPLVIWLPLFL